MKTLEDLAAEIDRLSDDQSAKGHHYTATYLQEVVAHKIRHWASEVTSQPTKGKTMMTKLESAMNLLERSAEVFAENPPDAGWFRDYFLLTGEHMILVDESWEPGSSLAEYRKEDAEFQPDDEVNVPDEESKLRTILANPCSDEEYEKTRKRLNEMSVASPSLAEEAQPTKEEK